VGTAALVKLVVLCLCVWIRKRHERLVVVEGAAVGVLLQVTVSWGFVSFAPPTTETSSHHQTHGQDCRCRSRWRYGVHNPDDRSCMWSAP